MVLLRFDRSGDKRLSRFSHPHRDDFSAIRRDNGCELVISNIRSSHSASYFCTCQRVGSHSETRSLQPQQKPVRGWFLQHLN